MKTNVPVKILLADDKEENLLALEVILANKNYEFVRASSGRDVLKILLKDPNFTILLMDVRMPLMDGFETAELIRQNERFKHIPIIFLTSDLNTSKDVFKGYQAGAVDYITKPVSSEILNAKVAVFVDLYKKNQELLVQQHHMEVLNDKLKQQSEYVRSLIEASQDPLITINSEGKITDMNEALPNLLGITREKITGTDFFNYFTKPQKALDIYKEVFAKGSVTDVLLTLRNNGGKHIEMLCNGSVYKDDKGNILGVVIVAREKLLSKYSRSLIEASLDPLITINEEGKITDMNEALANITGLPREKITGTDFFDYFTEPEKAREVYLEVFEKGSIVDSPLTIRHKDGKLTEVLFNGSVYTGDHGDVQGVVIVARDITARKKFENELIEAKKNAEEAMKSKQQFLSNMSHEIRTPMNAIIGFTKVTLKTNLDEKQKQYLHAIEVAGNTLIALINDILDLAKVDAGKMTFEKIPFKLSEAICDMLLLFSPKIKEKNIELVKHYDPSIPEVLIGDPVRLQQIILNLLSNAVKFTKEGTIAVSVRLKSENTNQATLEFSVADTGIGIPKDKVEKIFEDFQQATSGTSRLYGGTGLGLAIVKHLVEPQGGILMVKSKVGEGSIFSFILTFKKVKEEDLKEINPKTEAETRPEEEKAHLKNEMRNIKILVVEDAKLNQLLMKTVLEEFGFAMEIAPNGKIAIEKLQKNDYDIILMDLQMPEMNGFEATQHIRTIMKSQIPIIALTADVTTVDVEKCKAVGMDDYISKPIDDKLLYQKVIKHLKKLKLLTIN